MSYTEMSDDIKSGYRPKEAAYPPNLLDPELYISHPKFQDWILSSQGSESLMRAPLAKPYKVC